jgi:hypothetical protein
VDVKISVLPSGEKRGAVLCIPGAEKRTASPPSVVTTQISLTRRFSASLMRVA